MKAFGWLTLAILGLAFIALLDSFYVVRQDQQALVLQVGEPVAVRNSPGTDEAGLYFKIPFIQRVEVLDRKNLGLSIKDIDDVVAADQRRLTVDAFVRWRIEDPLKFFQRMGNERIAEGQIHDYTSSAMREALGDVKVPNIISGERAVLMDRIKVSVTEQLSDAGIAIIDVRILQADLPVEVAAGVYSRMQTERQQEAQRIRSEGEARARKIRAVGEREAVVVEAQAREAAEKIRGEGDAKSTEIYARAYTKDAEFFRFQRALIACEKAIEEGTKIIVGPDSLGLCDEFIDRARKNGR